MSSTEITKINHRIVFDSRGVETLEVDVSTVNGFARIAAPFGAPGSRGEFEAPAYAPGGLRDSIEILRKEIVPALVGMDALEQAKIDACLAELDGTENFERIGGNTSVALSLAVANAAANSTGTPLYKLLKDVEGWQLPVPLGNIVGGGAHSLGPAPDMQEHMAIPLGAKTVRQAIEINLQVHKEAGLILEKRGRGFAGGMDDEDAWAADLNDVEAIDVVEEAKKRVEDAVGVEIRMGLDLAADRMWNHQKGAYVYEREGVERNPQSQLEYVLELIDRYDMAYVEDAFTSTDYENFANLNASAGPNCLISADDIYATNIARTKVGIDAGSARAMIVKPNQVGTLTGARETAAFARANGVVPIISNRSGETPDTSIAPLAVAWGTAGIKAGVRGGGRIIKLNELIRIEEAVGEIELARWPLAAA